MKAISAAGCNITKSSLEAVRHQRHFEVCVVVQVPRPPEAPPSLSYWKIPITMPAEWEKAAVPERGDENKANCLLVRRDYGV